MFFILSKTLDVFLSPYIWALLFAALAVPWSARAARHWRRRRRFGVLAVALMVVPAVQPVGNGLLWQLEHSAPSTVRSEVTYDAVIVLGGLVDDEMSAQSGMTEYTNAVERLTEADALLRANRARQVIVTAGTHPEYPEFGEAHLIARQLEAWGVDKSRIIIEDRARNTRENALYTAEIVRTRGLHELLLVTSAFHMQRARECFAAVGLRPDTLAVDFHATRPRLPSLAGWIPRLSNYTDTEAVLREVFGRFVYRARGYGVAL